MDTRVDLGFHHVTLPVTDLRASVDFYTRYARVQVIHHRIDGETGSEVAWPLNQSTPSRRAGASFNGMGQIHRRRIS